MALLCIDPRQRVLENFAGKSASMVKQNKHGIYVALCHRFGSSPSAIGSGGNGIHRVGWHG
jgi:hypothetical protein